MKTTFAMLCALVAATSIARAEPFEAALHRQVRGTQGNLIYSPTSLRIALAMTMAGARGATQRELSKALQLPATPQTATSIGALVALWDGFDPGTVMLRVRDRVWVQRDHKLVDDYVKLLRDGFHSEIGVADFARDANGARDAINQWVANATQGMIPSLLGPGHPAPDTKIALTNVVYFRGKWAERFHQEQTTREPFFVDGKTRVMTPTMTNMTSERLARVDGALILEKEYGAPGSRIVMDIILPNERDGLAAIEDAYVKGALPKWLEKLEKQLVDVYLPKVTMSSTLVLSGALNGLGIVRATSSRDADFSGIDGARDLYIDEVVQKAIVEFDEEGAKAAAATYGGGVPMLALGDTQTAKPIVFRADHPFLFVIRDVSQGWVLFAGRVVDPTK